MELNPDISVPETEGDLRANLFIQRALWLDAKEEGRWNLIRQAQVNLDFLLDQMIEVTCS